MVLTIYYRYIENAYIAKLESQIIIKHIFFPSVLGYRSSDPEHITAILGQTVHFNCHANFPNDEVVPYVVQWEKRGSDTPIFIW